MPALVEMFKLRHRVFKERLGWEVTSVGGLESDEYDALDVTYVLSWRGAELVGCARLLPTTGPNMLRDTFPALLAGAPLPCGDRILEVSRLAIDTERAGRDAGIGVATVELLAGMFTYAHAAGVGEIVAVTDLRFETILRRAGLAFDRFAPPMQVGVTKAVAGSARVTRQSVEVFTDRLSGLLELVVAAASRRAA